MIYVFFLSFLSVTQLFYGAQFKSPDQNTLDHFHVCTIATHYRPTLGKLLISCKKHHINMNVIGMGRAYYGFATKFVYMMEYLDKLEDEDIVMFVDAFDVLILKDKEEILAKFLNLNTPFLVSAERNCWPYTELVDQYPLSSSPQRYINSGSYIGYVKNLKQFFSAQAITWHDDDQGLLTKYFINAPLESKPCTIDYECDLFLALYRVEENEVVIDKEKHSVLFLTTGAEPCVVHANGKSFPIWDKIYEQLFQDDTRRRSRAHRRRH